MAHPIKNLTESLTKMDLDSYLTFAMASLLISIGTIFIALTLILLNNLVHKYWKPVQFFTKDSWIFTPPARFADPHEVTPIDKTTEPHLKEVK